MTDTIDAAALVEFANEAAAYFEKRPTGDEDLAHWSNVYNAENCRKIAASLATMREALEPFAEAAASYDPEEGDDAQAAWAHDFTIGSLRRARRALGGSNAE